MRFFSLLCYIVFVVSSNAELPDKLPQVEPKIKGLFPILTQGSICAKGIVKAVRASYTTFNLGAQVSAYSGINTEGDTISSVFTTSSFNHNVYLINLEYLKECESPNSTRLTELFDSNFVPVPDSVKINIGDTLELDHFLGKWEQKTPHVQSYYMHLSGDYIVNGVRHKGYIPTPLLKKAPNSLRKESFKKLANDQIEFYNSNPRSIRIDLLSIDGQITKTFSFAPYERNIIDTGSLLFIPIMK